MKNDLGLTDKEAKKFIEKSRELQKAIVNVLLKADSIETVDVSIAIHALSFVLSKISMSKYDMDVDKCKNVLTKIVSGTIDCVKEENK